MPWSRNQWAAATAAVLVEGPDLVALEVEPAADGADQVGRDDARRLHPEVAVAVAVGHGLPGDLEHELVALGRDEAELLDLALEQLVGGDRRAVAHGGHVGAARPHQVEHLVDAVDEAVGRVGGGGRRLGGDQLTGRLVEGDDVGERAAGVDADANASGGLRHGAPRAGVGNRGAASAVRGVTSIQLRPGPGIAGRTCQDLWQIFMETLVRRVSGVRRPGQSGSQNGGGPPPHGGDGPAARDREPGSLPHDEVRERRRRRALEVVAVVADQVQVAVGEVVEPLADARPRGQRAAARPAGRGAR